MYLLIPQDVGAGTPQYIPPRVGCHPPLAHGRGNADNGNAALRQVQVFRLGRLFQIDAAARMDDAGGVQMLFGS